MPSQDAVAAHKSFVDSFVKQAQGSVTAKKVMAKGCGRDIPLTSAQREIAAKVIQEEREAAIHDVLAHLEFETTMRGAEIHWNGTRLPESPYASLHYDFIARLSGDAWPDEDN